MPQQQVSEVDVLRETVRHNEKGIDALTADLKEFRKEVNGKFERIDSKFDAMNNKIDASNKAVNDKFDAINTKIEATNKTVNDKFEAINNKFIALYTLITFSIFVPIGIAVYQSMAH